MCSFGEREVCKFPADTTKRIVIWAQSGNRLPPHEELAYLESVGQADIQAPYETEASSGPKTPSETPAKKKPVRTGIDRSALMWGNGG